MAVQDIPRREGPFVGDGEARAYPFPFLVFKETDVRVVRSISEDDNAGEEELSLGTDYTVSLNEDQETSPGGVVRLTTPLPAGIRLSIVSAVAATQEVVLTNHDGFYPEILNGALDKLTVLAQELQEQTSRNLQVPVTSEKSPSELLSDVMSAKVSADKVIPHIPSIETAADSIDKITTVADNVDDVNLTADNIEVLEKVASGLDVTRDGADVDYGHTTDPLATEVAASGALVAVANEIEAVQKLADNLDAIIEGGEIAESVKENADRAEAAAEAAVGQLHAVSYETQDLKQKERIQAKTNIGADYFVNVKDFGAKGDGVTNDTAAFKAASTAAASVTRGKVMVPAGKYILTPFTCAPVLFIGSGQGATVLAFRNLKSVAYTVRFDAPDEKNVEFGFDGVSFVAEDDGSTNDGVVFPERVDLYSLHARNILRGTTFSGSERITGKKGYVQNFGWRTCACLGDGVAHDVDMVTAYGTYDPDQNPEGQPKSKFLKLNAVGAMLSARITRVATFNVRDFVEIGDNSGWVISCFDQAYGERGVYSSGTSQFGEGIIQSGVLNVQREGIRLSSFENTKPYGESRACRIIDVAVNRSNDCFDGDWDWVGVDLDHIKVVWLTSLRVDSNAGSYPNASSVKGLVCNTVDSLTATNLKLKERHTLPIELVDCKAFLVDNVEFIEQVNAFASFSGKRTTGRIGQWMAYGESATGTARWRFVNGASEADLDIYRLYDRPTSENPMRAFNKINGGADAKRWDTVVDSVGDLLDRTLLDDGSIGATYRRVKRSGSDVSTVVFYAKQFDVQADDGVSRVWRPATDGMYTLGTAIRKWSEIFAATGAISTSDERAKASIEDPEEALMRAWGKVDFKTFCFKDAIAQKGRDARLHVGVIAQRIIDAFESVGLDATRYGLLCYDAWDDEYEDNVVVDSPEVSDADGRVIKPAATHIERRKILEAGNRYGVRYEEALCLEAAYQRWRLKKIEEHLGLNEVNNESK